MFYVAFENLLNKILLLKSTFHFIEICDLNIFKVVIF